MEREKARGEVEIVNKKEGIIRSEFLRGGI